MHVMSVPAQQKQSVKRTGKRITFFNEQSGDAMKESSQHQDGSYYHPTGNAVDPGQSEAASTVTSNPEGHHVYLNSVIFSPDKGDQSRGHYQQTVPMKWTQQEPVQHPQQQRQAGWSNMSNWGSNYANYIGGVSTADTRTQTAFVKSMHEQHPAPPPLPHQQQQPQAFPETLNPGALNPQQHAASHVGGGSSVLQPFQLAFGQPKQHLPPYFQAFQGSRSTLPNPPSYTSQTKPPLQLQPQIRPQQHHIIQQQHHHMQMIQPLQQQQQQQHEQKLQQQLQIQQMQHQQLPQQNPHVLDFYPAAQNTHPQPVVVHSQESSAPAPPKIQEPLIQDITPEPQQQPSDPLHPPFVTEPISPSSQPQLRRSRRLSKEGGAPSDNNPFLVSSPEQSLLTSTQGSQNGARDVQAAPTGVIQSTRRKRRVSQEVNLETLAQKASEMESLPSNIVKDPHRPWSPTDEGLNTKRPRDDSLVPLVIPVSVPVRRLESSPNRDEPALGATWTHRDLGRADHKPSVIVTRRRSLRNSLSESSEQNGATEGDKDDDSKKSKRRPRPEPLFIPLPKPSLFIAPPVYSSITPYQSHLRSPVRLIDNPLAMPPYTPPPILSPVREGSGLYFSTFLSTAAAAAAGGQGLPPVTPKSATRSLLRSNSADITPPVLTSMSEATPVSIEPRINIGSRYQAEVPELRQRAAVELDQHGAELVWAPLNELEENSTYRERVEDLMHLACSSVFCGGGTNQELVHHSLFECSGDVMAALSMLMLRNPIFPKSHHLANYHYSGSDHWTAAERRQFNKGITAHKKDFFMVRKQVCTKTVAQCVEFYYTYKKHVKIGRNGTLMYGETESEARTTEEEMDHKGSQRLEARDEDSRKWEGSADRKQDVCPTRATHTLQPADNPGTVLIMKSHEDQPLPQCILPHHPPAPPPVSKPRYDANARKASPSTVNKGTAATAGQEGEFPCKKCGRIFYKVKSRSAHMKSHAEQEKKAAALRQREAEERARVAKAAAEAAAILARQQNGTRQLGGDSTNEDSTDGEDEDDEDWQ